MCEKREVKKFITLWKNVNIFPKIRADSTDFSCEKVE